MYGYPGAPSPAYGYGAPPPAWGAPPSYGAPPGPPQAWGAPPAHGAQSPAYGAQPAGPPQAWGPPPGQPTQPPAGGYPSMVAPPPPEVVGPSTAGNPSSSAQRPTSAYPSVGGAHNPGFGAPDTTSRPSSAMPGYSGAPAFGAYPAAQPPPAAPAPAAAYTYGQTSAHAQAPPAQLPPTYMPPTTYAPAPGHGGRRRRALLVGCAYPGSSAALNGCLNDVQCIKFCLQQRFGFTEQEIVTLRDDSRNRDFTSTKMNILRGIHWMMTDQRPGDSLFFHFSGHGSQQYDRNGDEEDGKDETLCPTDFRTAGQLVDDELNRLMIQPLIPGVTLHAVIDACHSGTALDLPFRAKVDGSGRWYWKGRGRYDKMTRGGTAFQFGACKDHQVAQDTNALSGKAYTGAATFCFIQAIEKYGAQQTYGQLLGHMMSTLRAHTGGGGGLNLGSATSMIASMLLGTSMGTGGQTPVLSCDKQVDMYATRLSL